MFIQNLWAMSLNLGLCVWRIGPAPVKASAVLSWAEANLALHVVRHELSDDVGNNLFAASQFYLRGK